MGLCQAGPLTHQLTQELHAGEAAGTALRVKRVCTAGGEVTTGRAPPVCRQNTNTGDKALATGKSRLADARRVMLSIVSPKGHELQQELFLRYC